MFSRTKGTYADPFGRCPMSLEECPVATQGTECLVVDGKTRPQSCCAKETLQAETNSFSRTPIYFEYPVRLINVSWMATMWQAKQTDTSYGPCPKSSMYFKPFQEGKKIHFISIKWSLALRDELLLTRFYNGFLLWFWACSHCSLFQGPYMIWGRAGQERKEVPTLFGYCFLASNCLEVNLRLFPAFLPPFLMPNSHSLLLPHPFLHQKKAKVLTICLWLGKNVCSTRGNFSGPSELKILMSWENLGWGRREQKTNTVDVSGLLCNR